MREKLNKNPVAQIALIGVLVLAVGYLFMSNMSGSGESSSSPETAVAESPEAGAVEEGAEGTASLEGAIPAASTSAVSAPSSAKLPQAIESAYASGKDVVLLIYRRGGIDDALVAASASALTSLSEVAFFPVPTDKIARYSTITGPLGVNQSPALIVIRSRKLNGGAAAPATVDYGFRSAADVIQAVIDAGYQGPQLSYAPN